MSKVSLKREDVYAFLWMAGLTIILLWPYLFSKPTPLIYPESSLGTDLPREIWPLAYFVKQSLLSTGELPLWRPYLLSGAPIIGHPVAPIFYPPNWIALFMPIALALNLGIAIHIFWMGLGTYLYLKWETGTRWEASLISAIIFSQAPMWIAHISGGHLPMLAAIAWWPWVWLGWNRYLTTTKSRWVVVVGVGLAGQILNHGMFAALSLLAIAIFTLVQLIQFRALVFKRLIKGWIISLVVAFSLSAIQLLPFFELVGDSTRATITQEDAGFGSLPPPLLLSALFPPDLKFPEWFLYPGIGALALVMTGLALGWSRRERFTVIVLIGSLVLALGTSTPLFDILYSIIPGYSVLRVPARWWLFSLFAISLLAGWGLEKWLTKASRTDSRTKAVLIAFGLFYGLTAVLALIATTTFPFVVLPSAIGVIMILLIVHGAPSKKRLILIASMVVIDLWWTTAGLLRPQPASDSQISSPIIKLLMDAAQKGERSFAPYGGFEMSKLAAFNLRAADGYDPFAINAYSRFVTYASGCDYFSYSATAPPTGGNPAAVQECPEFKPVTQLLSLLNIRYLLLPNPGLFPNATPLLSSDGLWVYQLPSGFGRAFSVTEGLVISADECPQILRNIDVSAMAALEVDLPFVTQGKPITVISQQATNNSESFLVEVTDPGLLVRSENWAPAWRAFVDGSAVDVYRVDCILQGVWLEPGDHKVDFSYEPNGYIIGRSISLVTCLILLAGLGLLGFRCLRERRDHGRHSSSFQQTSSDMGG